MEVEVSQTELPDSITISTPDNWTEYPVGSDGFRVMRDASLAKLHEAGGVSRSDARVAEVYLAALQRLLAEGKVVFLAGVMELIAGEDDVGPLMAAVGVSSVARQDLGVDVPLRLDSLLQAFTNNTTDHDEGITFDDIEPPQVAVVGSYETVRLVRLMRRVVPGREEHRQFCVTYMVPVADGDGMIMLQFSTINLEHAKPFSEVFAKIAASLRILYPEDETPTVMSGMLAEEG